MDATNPVSNASEFKVCEKRLEYAVTKNTAIQIILHSIESIGCKLPPNFFSCTNCSKDVSGGFEMNNSQPNVLICANNKMDSETFGKLSMVLSAMKIPI
jgi:hypothetical protein